MVFKFWDLIINNLDKWKLNILILNRFEKLQIRIIFKIAFKEFLVFKVSLFYLIFCYEFSIVLGQNLECCFIY